MAVRRGKSLLFCFGFACVLSASGQTVIPASNSDQAAVTPTPAFEAPGVSNPTICAQGDDSCSAALVQPDNDTDYTNCINSPSAPDCTSSSPSAAIESAVATPEEACPTDSILDQGMSEADLETQVAACVNAVRQDPDAFACDYPCTYSDWRASVISPARGALVSSGTVGVQDLDATAIEHSTDMAVNAYFSHVGTGNRTLQERAESFGFDTFPLGENIAAGYNSVRAVVLAWMCSEGHRTNLMGCGFDTMGTGVIQNDTAPYKLYYTQDFGCSLDTYDCTCPDTAVPETTPPTCSESPSPTEESPPPPVAASPPPLFPVASPPPPSPPSPPPPSPPSPPPPSPPSPPPPSPPSPPPPPPPRGSPPPPNPPPPPPPRASPPPPNSPPPVVASPPPPNPPSPPPPAASPPPPSPTPVSPPSNPFSPPPPASSPPPPNVPPSPVSSPPPPPTVASTSPASTTSLLTSTGSSTSPAGTSPVSAPAPTAILGVEVPAPPIATSSPESSPEPDFSQTAGFSLVSEAEGPAAESYTFGQSPTSESPSTPGSSSSSPGPNALGLSSPEVSARTSNVSGCLYTTYMEHYGSAQQLAVTNMETAVIVASFGSNVTALPASAIELQLDNGQNGTVSDVQPFPGQATVFLIEVQHPASYEGKVTVSLPQDAAVQPLSYNVVSRPLVVQNLGFDVCSAA
ncbi:hypothetical protein WJX77_003783 [Trebouxia sp. C0004]